jgi:hypothetical protein
MVNFTHPSTEYREQTGDKTAEDLVNASVYHSLSQVALHTTTPIACCGLSPNDSNVLPVDQAEIHDPDTVQ